MTEKILIRVMSFLFITSSCGFTKWDLQTWTHIIAHLPGTHVDVSYYVVPWKFITRTSSALNDDTGTHRAETRFTAKDYVPDFHNDDFPPGFPPSPLTSAILGDPHRRSK